jgi:ubiquinone/menaquinone biosynthesis C-methylase UbiE
MAVNTNAWNRLRYTLYAPFYDWFVRFGRARRRSIDLLQLRPGERVLIVGAGTGADLDYLPPDVDVTATDLTPTMVNRTALRAARLHRHVEVRVMDAQALEFPDDSFDAVILHLIVAVVPDPARALREVARVLRPGGRVAVFDKFAPEGRAPSLTRRAANLIANLLFTDLTRQLEPVALSSGLVVVQREPAIAGGLFEIAQLRHRSG